MNIMEEQNHKPKQNLPVLLVNLQDKLRKTEKNPNLDVLEYMLNDYDKMSTNDMERKYNSPPINHKITSYSIIKYLKELGHAQIRHGSDKMIKSKFYLKS